MKLSLIERIIPGVRPFKQGQFLVGLLWLLGIILGSLNHLIVGGLMYLVYLGRYGGFERLKWLIIQTKHFCNGQANSSSASAKIGEISIVHSAREKAFKRPFISQDVREFIQETSALTYRLLLQLKRRPSSLLAGIIQPLIWLIFFGSLFQKSSIDLLNGNHSYPQFVAAGLIVFTAFNGALSSGLIIMFDREFGFLNRLLIAPLASRLSIVFSSAIYIVFLSIIQTTCIMIASAFLGATLPNILGLGIIFLIVFLVIFAVTNVSIALAFALPGHVEMLAFIFVINLPILFASTALAPFNSMAKWLAYVASINPLTYAIEAIRYLYLSPHWELGSAVLVCPWGQVTLAGIILLLLGFDLVTILLIKPILNRFV